MTEIVPVTYKQNPRVSLQDILPTAITSPAFNKGLIQSTQATTNGPYSIPNNGALTVQSIISSNKFTNVPLGALPYCIVFFQGSLNTNNIIGVGVLTGYVQYGPFPMPTFTPNANVSGTKGGSDGNNLVFYTSLVNTSGSTQTVYYITDTRFIQPIGSGAK